MNSFNLKEHELNVEQVYRNLAPSALYEHAILYQKDAHIAENGALVAYFGAKTGRSPKDRRVVKQSPSENDVWWGSVNIPLEPETFAINRERAKDYLNSRERLYCFDGFAGWDSKYRIKVRVVTQCSNVPNDILAPRNVWFDKVAYEATARRLADLFTRNFAQYDIGASAEVKSAGPTALSEQWEDQLSLKSGRELPSPNNPLRSVYYE